MSDAPAGPWPSNRYPTPREFADWFVSLDYEDQLLVAAGVVQDSERAMTCLIGNHRRRLEEAERRRYAASVEDYQARTNPPEDIHA